MKNKLLLRKIILTNILIFSSVTGASADSRDYLHVGVSTLIGGVGQYYLQDWRYSMATCLSVGVVKELYDEVDNKGFSKKDLALDGLGCTLGVLATSYFWPNASDNPNKLSFSMKDNETSIQYNYLF